MQAREFVLDNFFPWRTRVTSSARPLATPAFLTKSFLLTSLCAIAWFSTAIAGLWQWNAENVWGRFDIFSVGILALLFVWCCSTCYFHREMFTSREVMMEASGMTFDKLMFFWIDVFAAAEVLLFFEYGHWHLVPQLCRLPLQIAGLAICTFGTAWLVWTDMFLSQQFQNLRRRNMMCSGPYRFVRHPRYAGLILCSIGISLALGSAIGWALAVGWFFVNVQRVHLEEGHLRSLFGAEYEDYASRTARFFPGVY